MKITVWMRPVCRICDRQAVKRLLGDHSGEIHILRCLRMPGNMGTAASEQNASLPVEWLGAPLTGKSLLIVEDEPLIAFGVEFCLLDAGAELVKTVNSIAAAESALDQGIPFDAAIVDLILADENAFPLVQILSERGIPVVISTGADIDLGHPALGKAVAFLQKPYDESELIEALVEWAAN